MSNVTVSVIIPFYDHVDWLIEAVDSVFAQTFTDFEVIVINDGSTEDISVFLEKYEHKIIYKWKENGGPGSARNFGIELAKGKYIAFLDSDDLWFEEKIAIQVDFMEKNDYMWSHTKFEHFWENSAKRNVINNKYACEIVFIKSLVSLKLATPSLMVKKDVFNEDSTLRFSEDMRYGQDSFLYIKIAYQFPLGLVEEVLTSVRMRGSNAAFKARIRLQVRSNIWDYLRMNNKEFFGKRKVNWLIRFIYKIYKYSNYIVDIFGNKLPNSVKLIELLSKFFCILPYTIEKIYYVLFLRNIKEFKKD